MISCAKPRKNETTGPRSRQCKEAATLSNGETIRFNDAIIWLENGTYSISAAHHVKKLEHATDATSFAAQGARGAYIASICRPDLTIFFSKAAQVTEPESKDLDFENLNKIIDRCQATASQGLKYVPMNASGTRLATFVDGSFTDNKDLSSQLGYITAIMDDNDNANIIHYSSAKSKRITRSVLAAKLSAMAAEFDIAAATRPTISKIVGSEVPLVICTDSKSLYNALVTINTTTEKRLLIDLKVNREAYEMKEVAEICWIPTDQNPADGLTKERPNQALSRMIAENRLVLTPSAWVERGVGRGGALENSIASKLETRKNIVRLKFASMQKGKPSNVSMVTHLHQWSFLDRRMSTYGMPERHSLPYAFSRAIAAYHDGIYKIGSGTSTPPGKPGQLCTPCDKAPTSPSAVFTANTWSTAVKSRIWTRNKSCTCSGQNSTKHTSTR